MTSGAILALDQGTSSTKGVLVLDGRIVAQASRPIETRRPRPDWAEQDGDALWSTTAAVIEELIGAGHPISAVALSNQRETVGLWDAEGRPVAPFVLWQCRRSSDRCAALRDVEADIIHRTGLALDPMFSAGKLAWLLDSSPDLRRQAAHGRLRAGTVDSWLIWRLTGGVHATDTSNASRTQLMNLRTLAWDPVVAGYFDIPLDILPPIQASAGHFGSTVAGASALPAGVPILASLGDSHAALFGHGFEGPGRVKATCGTGSSLMAVTDQPLASSHGLSTTIAWTTNDVVRYALEGNIVVSGQALTFTARLLGCRDEAELFDLARSVPDSAGVVLVPAMSGLGAPHWRDDARGVIAGITLGVERGHVARAAIEGVALQIRDVFEAMKQDLGLSPPSLSIDGGAAASDLLAQTLADLINTPVLRPAHQNLSALGAARLAASALGRPFTLAGDDARFEPAMPRDRRDRILDGWSRGLAKTMN